MLGTVSKSWPSVGVTVSDVLMTLGANTTNACAR